MQLKGSALMRPCRGHASNNMVVCDPLIEPIAAGLTGTVWKPNVCRGSRKASLQIELQDLAHQYIKSFNHLKDLSCFAT